MRKGHTRGQRPRDASTHPKLESKVTRTACTTLSPGFTAPAAEQWRVEEGVSAGQTGGGPRVLHTQPGAQERGQSETLALQEVTATPALLEQHAPAGASTATPKAALEDQLEAGPVVQAEGPRGREGPGRRDNGTLQARAAVGRGRPCCVLVLKLRGRPWREQKHSTIPFPNQQRTKC